MEVLMRKVSVNAVRDKIKEMCIEANFILGNDVYNALKNAENKEESMIGKSILSDLITNADIARNDHVPMCQDTGMTVIFMEVGQDVAFVDGNIKDAINEGVRQGYSEGFLRKSVVSDPLERVNTKDNTPAVIHFDIVEGENVSITVAPKGFGSENMSQIKMLKPSDGVKGVEEFVVEVVSQAGPNPCPPIVVGVGVGGTLEKAALIAKKALMRDVDKESELAHIKELEGRLLKKINDLGIGPQGLGGRTTALGVNVEVYPTHIAGLPVVVNINCHASRHVKCVI